MNKLPEHIGFIMDGNGRWAKNRLMPRKLGHKKGVDALKSIIPVCNNLSIKVITFYAFSTENWSRPEDEITSIFSYFIDFVDNELDSYKKDNYRINFLGDISKFDKKMASAIKKMIDSTKDNAGMIINFALNYGGRSEIVNAVNTILQDKSITKIDEEIFSQYLYTKNLPDPDIIVRTAGESRLSNFLTWQSAYSELIFVDELWPDFNKASLLKVLEIYKKRDRKFGNISEKK